MFSISCSYQLSDYEIEYEAREIRSFLNDNVYASRFEEGTTYNRYIEMINKELSYLNSRLVMNNVAFSKPDDFSVRYLENITVPKDELSVRLSFKSIEYTPADGYSFKDDSYYKIFTENMIPDYMYITK